jgi:uncharacterized membrane protein
MGFRKWIWTAVLAQVAGLAFDVVWHGVINPGFEAVTVGEMARHLSTVHLPIYIGAVSVLVTTVWALVADARRSAVGIALPVACAGAVVSTAGEAWHAYSHLQLSTHGGPIAAFTSFLGLITVVGALWLERRQGRRRRGTEEVEERRRAA